MIALQFYDKYNNCILESGESVNFQFKRDQMSFPVKEILLEEGERIVGIKSGQRG